MGTKTRNLDYLVNSNINVHNYKEIDNINDLIELSNIYNKFSIRFDNKDIIHNLPFYIYDKDIIENKEEYFNNIINEMNRLNCTLLCSDGYSYDNDLLFNFVIEIKDDFSFILELCDKKIPLRDIYKYKTTIIKGNILDKKYEYINRLENKYSLDNIEYLLDWIISLDKKFKYLEGTLYNKKLGIYNDNIVIWQTN